MVHGVFTSGILTTVFLISIKVFGRSVKIQLRIWLYLHNNGTDKTECLSVVRC